LITDKLWHSDIYLDHLTHFSNSLVVTFTLLLLLF